MSSMVVVEVDTVYHPERTRQPAVNGITTGVVSAVALPTNPLSGIRSHHSRIYNLLALRNGTDTLLSSSLITTGKILKIKILLGSDNEVYIDSTANYPLVVFRPDPLFHHQCQPDQCSHRHQ